MSYIDKNTFQLWSDSNIDNQFENSFEVDEVIAPVIRCLNLKGYTTEFSCSGHPGKTINEAIAMSDCPDPWHVIVGTIAVEPRENGESRIISTQYKDDLYIKFAIPLEFLKEHSLPDGFYQDGDTTVRYDYIDHDYFQFLKERTYICERLFLWAESLPMKAA